MKRSVVLVAVLLLCATAVFAKEYQSSFGLTFNAPDNWLVITKLELAGNPTLAGTPGSGGSLTPEIKGKIESGSIEFLYDRTTSDAAFADNVNVRLGGKGSVPNNSDAVKTQCTQYAQALAKSAGRTLAVAKCDTRELGASRTFYVEYEGRVAGTVTMQYQLVRPDGKLLYVTATCKQSIMDKFHPEFEAIVRSIRFN